jgi:hypothetical protein
LKIYFTCIAGTESFILGRKINKATELKSIGKKFCLLTVEEKMSRIIEEMVNNPSLLEYYKKKPEYNLVKVQTLTGSNYLGYINSYNSYLCY